MKAKKTENLVRIRSVKPLEEFTVLLEFTDGTRKTANLGPFLVGPIFRPIREDPRVFRSVKVDPLAGTIAWDNGADIDPDVLYRGLEPARLAKKREPA